MHESPIWTGSEWQWDLISRVYDECDLIAREEMGLSIYPNQLEMISSEQMLDAYASVGMPIYYKHWSFGKHFVRESRNYHSGSGGLAYELVINSSPCINYLMEDNTMTTQALVIAHAAFGHNHFFKNNYLFKQWTDASSIVDYLIFARDYIAEAELKHGKAEVEKWLDSCHALMDHGVNRYKRPSKISMKKEKQRQRERAEYLQSQVSELYRLLPRKRVEETTEKPFPPHPEENLLYFFEKYSPEITEWQREVLRIVRKIAQYFYPQAQTKVMNEGFASFAHYTIMNRLHEKGLTTDGAQLEFLALHTNVLYQPPYNSKRYNGLNPYALGFAMLKDIERMCQCPTSEDLKWFPGIANRNGLDIILEGVADFRDESFIRQWLSPKVMRDFRLFDVRDDRSDDEQYVVTEIHNERGYEEIRQKLADSYLRSAMVPHIEVCRVDRKTRTLFLQYNEHMGLKLANVDRMLPHVTRLWGGYPVVILDQWDNSIARSQSC